jgi:hypothetical protein
MSDLGPLSIPYDTPVVPNRDLRDAILIDHDLPPLQEKYVPRPTLQQKRVAVRERDRKRMNDPTRRWSIYVGILVVLFTVNVYAGLVVLLIFVSSAIAREWEARH